MPLKISEPWDIVVVPFPFTEKAGRKRRPALIISKKEFNENGHTLLLMITTTQHHPWPGDTPISDLQSSGLNVDCIVRLKAFTLDNRLILRKIGHLTPSDRVQITQKFHQFTL